jgi:hypothetical protein
MELVTRISHRGTECFDLRFGEHMWARGPSGRASIGAAGAALPSRVPQIDMRFP